MHILDRLFGGPNPTQEQIRAWKEPAENHVKESKARFIGTQIDVMREYWIYVPVKTRRVKEMHEMTASEAMAPYGRPLKFVQMQHGDLWNDRVFPIYDAMTKEDIGL
jgi:hypothetical protein